MGTAFTLLAETDRLRLYKRTKTSKSRKTVVEYVLRSDWWINSHVVMLDYPRDPRKFVFKKRADAEREMTVLLLKLSAT